MTDHNDCSVYAIADAFGLDVENVRGYLARNGRRAGEGISAMLLILAVEELCIVHGYRQSIWQWPPSCTISDVCNMRGSFMVITANHVMCVINGAASDNTPKHEKVMMLFRVERLNNYPVTTCKSVEIPVQARY